MYLFTFCMLFSLHFNIPEILNYKHDVVCTIVNVAYNSDGWNLSGLQMKKKKFKEKT